MKSEIIYIFETRDPLHPHATNFTKGIIVARGGPKSYKIKNSEGDEIFRHEDQIKFHYTAEIRLDDVGETPPQRHDHVYPADRQSTSNG